MRLVQHSSVNCSRYLFDQFIQLYTDSGTSVGHRTCDSRVAGSTPGRAPPRSGLGQATYACMLLSPSSIIWYQSMGVMFLAGKVTVGLVESNGSLPMNESAASPTLVGWLRGTVVERRSLAGELSLSCARPAADGQPLMWVNRPL